MNSRPGPDPDPANETSSIVRLYTLTGGRTRPRHRLSMHTVVGAGRRTPPDVSEESAKIIELCGQHSRPLVELSGLLKVHLTAVMVLVSDLIDAGAVSLPVPETPGQDRDTQKLLALSAALKTRWPQTTVKAG
ncbi:DUF742 domain-containing protein [Streptomyces sp. NPDC047072]|uniref:DUF742 domain-containing protein n=1 Tax=Streptomyces sp. NPDC047072 TaxID=3154809 RepID=UPI0033E8BB8D